MAFNASKCCVVHFSVNNPETRYTLNGETIPCKANLGLSRDGDLDYNTHCDSLVVRGHQLCGSLFRGFSTRRHDILTFAYTTFIRPVLDFAACVWSPRSLFNIHRLERIQRKFTKGLPGLHATPYQDRLRILNLDELTIRCLILDLRLLYKIVHALVDIRLDEIGLSINLNNTRAHGLRLVLPRPRTNILRSHFSYRVGHVWNQLPVNVISAPSFATFLTCLHTINSETLRGYLARP